MTKGDQGCVCWHSLLFLQTSLQNTLSFMLPPLGKKNTSMLMAGVHFNVSVPKQTYLESDWLILQFVGKWQKIEHPRNHTLVHIFSGSFESRIKNGRRPFYVPELQKLWQQLFTRRMIYKKNSIFLWQTWQMLWLWLLAAATAPFWYLKMIFAQC